MAVSRLRVESEVPDDIVSDVLWRDPHIQRERGRDRGGGREREFVTEQESMSEKEGERDNILRLYGVIVRYMAAFLPAIPLNHLVLVIKYSHTRTVIAMAALYRALTNIIIIEMYNCTVGTVII